MDKVHVLVTVPFLGEENLKKIEAIDPSVKVTFAIEEIRAELGIIHSSVLPLSYTEKLKFTAQEATARLDSILADTDVIFSWLLPRSVIKRAPRLKWIQHIGAGIEAYAGNPGFINSKVVITNGSGVNSTAVAEYALYLMLALAKKAPKLFSNQAALRWERINTQELAGKTVGIVGLGHIGGRIAGMARAFGMRILAVKRSAAKREKNVEGVDEIFPRNQLTKMLSECDFVIVTVPLTAETRGMIGDAELRAMKPTASIINVARGPVIDEAALLLALKEGRVAGAGLDVFEKEPLPTDSELWKLPNVIVSPHLAGVAEHEVRELMALFCQNLERFLRGKELINVVDLKRGY
jgi:D-2-hydroxyacid dehydrogenase (NADP+)